MQKIFKKEERHTMAAMHQRGYKQQDIAILILLKNILQL